MCINLLENDLGGRRLARTSRAEADLGELFVYRGALRRRFPRREGSESNRRAWQACDPESTCPTQQFSQSVAELLWRDAELVRQFLGRRFAADAAKHLARGRKIKSGASSECIAGPSDCQNPSGERAKLGCRPRLAKFASSAMGRSWRSEPVYGLASAKAQSRSLSCALSETSDLADIERRIGVGIQVSHSRNLLFATFSSVDRGKSSTRRTSRGTLKLASDIRHAARIRSSSARAAHAVSP